MNLFKFSNFFFNSSIEDYYMQEACAYFAIALARKFGYNLCILIDDNSYYDEDEQYPAIAHVFAKSKNNKCVDIKGVRSISEIKNDFWDLDSPHVIDVTEEELKKYMGEDDSKPLYPYNDNEINDALVIINDNENLYKS